jgi:hypothetical protein
MVAGPVEVAVSRWLASGDLSTSLRGAAAFHDGRALRASIAG